MPGTRRGRLGVSGGVSPGWVVCGLLAALDTLWMAAVGATAILPAMHGVSSTRHSGNDMIKRFWETFDQTFLAPLQRPMRAGGGGPPPRQRARPSATMSRTRWGRRT